MQTLFSTAVPQYRTTVDRDKAKTLGVPLTSIFDTMQSAFGSALRQRLHAVRPHVPRQPVVGGRLPPLAGRHALPLRARPRPARWCRSTRWFRRKRIIGPDTVDRFNIFPAAKIMGNPAPGFSSGQALAAIQEVVQQGAAGRLHDRLDRLGLPGGLDRGHRLSGLPVRPDHGVPDPRRPVRALVAAAGGADRGAVRAVRRDRRDLRARASRTISTSRSG